MGHFWIFFINVQTSRIRVLCRIRRDSVLLELATGRAAFVSFIAHRFTDFFLSGPLMKDDYHKIK